SSNESAAALPAAPSPSSSSAPPPPIRTKRTPAVWEPTPTSPNPPTWTNFSKWANYCGPTCLEVAKGIRIDTLNQTVKPTSSITLPSPHIALTVPPAIPPPAAPARTCFVSPGPSKARPIGFVRPLAAYCGGPLGLELLDSLGSLGSIGSPAPPAPFAL